MIPLSLSLKLRIVTRPTRLPCDWWPRVTKPHCILLPQVLTSLPSQQLQPNHPESQPYLLIMCATSAALVPTTPALPPIPPICMHASVKSRISTPDLRLRHRP